MLKQCFLDTSGIFHKACLYWLGHRQTAVAHLGRCVQPLPHHWPLALGSSSSFLQQGGDDVIGDVKKLLVDLLVLAEIIVATGEDKVKRCLDYSSAFTSKKS